MPGDVVCCAGSACAAAPAWAWRRAWCSRSTARASAADVAFVTDGQLSGLVNKGLVVGEVNPEAATGGPLALVADGDPISIDAEAGTIDLDVPEAELATRRARLKLKRSAFGGRLARDLRTLGAAAQKGAALVHPK